MNTLKKVAGNIKRIAVILPIFIFATQFVSAQKAINRSKSKANFSVTNLGMKVEGSIRGMYGEVNFDENDLANRSVNAYLDIRAIRTGNKKRDEHLMNEDFFHKDKFPKMSFESASFRKDGDEMIVVGNLTIKDVTKKVEVAFSKNGDVFTGKFAINRQDYGVDSGSLLAKGISDEVQIKFIVDLGE